MKIVPLFLQVSYPIPLAPYLTFLEVSNVQAPFLEIQPHLHTLQIMSSM